MIFDEAKVLSLAAHAGIDRDAALAHMTILQLAVAHATAVFNIEIACGIRPPARAVRG